MSNLPQQKQNLNQFLSLRIKKTYQNLLKQPINYVYYYLFDSNLVVIIEGTVTQPEILLSLNNRSYLAQEVRAVIDGVIQPEIKTIIEEIMEVKVRDFLYDTTIKSNLTGAIAILEI